MRHWLLVLGLLFVVGCDSACNCDCALAEATHPALLPPDGMSHRGDKMVGSTLTSQEDILKLGKLYQDAKEFETKQEYFLRLLDYFFFSKKRFVGMKRSEIEVVFGKGRDSGTYVLWHGGRDSVQVWFKDNIATGAAYIMGF